MFRYMFLSNGAVRRLILSVFLLALMMLHGCSTDKPVQAQHDKASIVSDQVRLGDLSNGSFKLEPRHSYIRSYPGGGGIYIIRLVPAPGFDGEVELSVEADALLNASLSTEVLTAESPIAEITIRPETSADIGTYFIDVTGNQPGSARRASQMKVQTLKLEVDLWNLGVPDPQYAIERSEDLMKWAMEKCPGFDGLSNQNSYSYLTYPGIWVVEHWTFMTNDWEIRFCFHVMIPPYDWSMILVRERGEWDPAIAGRREHDGVDYKLGEIAISEYPTFYGY